MAVNIGNTKFGSFNNTVFLEGSLINKTKSGIAWLYLFDNQTSKESKPDYTGTMWAKRVAGLWANGKASDSDFYNMIQYLIRQNIMASNNKESGSFNPVMACIRCPDFKSIMSTELFSISATKSRWPVKSMSI